MRLALLLALACTPDPTPIATPPAALPAGNGGGVALAWEPPSSLSVAPRSRRDALPFALPPAGPFVRISRQKHTDIYRAPLPFRRVFFAHQPGAQPEGFQLVQPSGWAFDRSSQAPPHSWRLDEDALIVRVAPGAPSPRAADFLLRYERAIQLDRALSFDTAGVAAEPFVFRSLDLTTDQRRGLYLPAPSTVSWDLELPTEAVLSFQLRLISPEISSGKRSDGARLELRIGDQLERIDVPTDHWQQVRIPVRSTPGGHTTVSLRTLPGPTPWLDQVFLADPVIYHPVAHPRRVLLLFADTVRADRLSMYGGPRPTTPKLDSWAQGAVLFEQTRSVAPWTLPSARAALSGVQPERWDDVQSLPERLARQGWATEATTANAFLTPDFGFGAGWGRYHYRFLAPASEQVSRGLEALARHPDRDLLLQVQLMDAHLPYREPPAYQQLFAGAPPRGLEKLGGHPSRRAIERLHISPDQRGAARDYLLARYDQNLRVLDDALPALIEAVGPDAVVVFWSDHGEEFWEHGGFEHGHQLWDELLHVPLVLWAPGLPPGRVDAPTSLLDLSPTLLALLDQPHADLEGLSLIPAAKGDPDALQRLRDRPQGFGRTLRGPEAWGSLLGQRKYISRAGVERVYATSAGEPALTSPDFEPFRQALTLATGRPVLETWRLVGPGSGKAWRLRGAQIRLSHPDGLRAVWTGYQPVPRGLPPVLQGGVVTLTADAKGDLPREVFILPNNPGSSAALTLSLDLNGQHYEATAGGSLPSSLKLGPAQLRVTSAVVPAPTQASLPGAALEMRDALRALGYIEPTP